MTTATMTAPTTATYQTQEYRGYTGTYWYEQDERGFNWHGIVNGIDNLENCHHFYAICPEDIQADFQDSIDYTVFAHEVMPEMDKAEIALFHYLNGHY